MTSEQFSQRFLYIVILHSILRFWTTTSESSEATERRLVCEYNKAVSASCKDLASENQILLFIDDMCWTYDINERRISKGQKIKDRWPQVSTPLNAAFARENKSGQHMYFFIKNTILWVCQDKTCEEKPADEGSRIDCLDEACGTETCLRLNVLQGHTLACKFQVPDASVDVTQTGCVRDERVVEDHFKGSDLSEDQSSCNALALFYKGNVLAALYVADGVLHYWKQSKKVYSVDISTLFDCSDVLTYILIGVAMVIFFAFAVILVTIGLCIFCRKKKEDAGSVTFSTMSSSERMQYPHTVRRNKFNEPDSF